MNNIVENKMFHKLSENCIKVETNPIINSVKRKTCDQILANGFYVLLRH